MKIKSVFFTLLPVATLSLAVHASPINITCSQGAGVNYAPESDLQNCGNSVNNWLSSDISCYNSLNGNCLTGQNNSACQTGQPNYCQSLTLDVTGCDYVCLSWGGQNGGCDQCFYVGNCSGDCTFYEPCQGGCTFYCCYCRTVPETGSTMFMLGSSLGGLGLFAMIRRFKV